MDSTEECVEMWIIVIKEKVLLTYLNFVGKKNYCVFYI